jgi:transposase InsO family protein
VSKAELVITAVVLEGRTQAEVARAYGVSKGWVSKLVARYRVEGEAAFEPRSRRPHTSPRAAPAASIDLVLSLRKRLTEQGLDAGADTLVWHLRHDHQLTLSRASVHRILTRHGAVTAEPKKRPKSSWIRFEAAMPNECWQSDFTHYPLADGTDTEIITWLDDCSRYLLHVSAHTPVTAKTVLATFRATAQEFGYPASTLTDNGMVYTVRLASHAHRGGRTALEAELHRLHITQKNSRPNHPTTCGKVERVQQTLKKWLRAQPDQPDTIEQLQALIDAFVEEYNHRRPHRSLPHRAVPAAIYTTMPKAVPTADQHQRQPRPRPPRPRRP